MVSNFMNAGHDMTKAQYISIKDEYTWYNDGYHCYYAGGNRGDCKHPLFSDAYECWHQGYSAAEDEDKE